MGGWFLADDLIRLYPDMTINALLKVVMENDKQRFQLAVHTVDGLNANDRRVVTRIYAIRCTSGHSIATMREPEYASRGKYEG